MRKKQKRIVRIAGGIFLLICLFFYHNFQYQEVSITLLLENLAAEAVMTGSTNDWIYYSLAGDETTKGGLWRIHKETRDKELVWEGRYCMFLVLGEELFVQDRGEGVYRMEPDGSNPELIFEGTANAHDLYYEDGWVYFSIYDNRPEEDTAVSGQYLRYHIKTKKTEIVLAGIRTSTWAFHSNFVVSGEDFYAVVWSEGKRGILSYNLKTGKQKICLDLDTGIEAPSIDGGYALFLADSGEEELILAYFDLKKMAIPKNYVLPKKEEPLQKKRFGEKYDSQICRNKRQSLRILPVMRLHI